MNLNWLYLRMWPNKLLRYVSTDTQRKAFFIREYQQMVHRMWRGEFVMAKKKEIREDIRRQYDKVNEDLLAVKNAYNNEEKKLNQETREKLRGGIENKEKDIVQFKEQIDQIDKEMADLNELLKGYQEGLKLLKEIVNQ